MTALTWLTDAEAAEARHDLEHDLARCALLLLGHRQAPSSGTVLPGQLVLRYDPATCDWGGYGEAAA